MYILILLTRKHNSDLDKPICPFLIMTPSPHSSCGFHWHVIRSRASLDSIHMTGKPLSTFPALSQPCGPPIQNIHLALNCMVQGWEVGDLGDEPE